MFIKSEILRIVKSKRCIFFIFLMSIIPIVDLIIMAYSQYGPYIRSKYYYINGYPKSNIIVAAKGAFLSGSTRGHLAQMLLIWILPLYLMIIYSDGYIQEKKVGYNTIIFSKVPRKKMLYSRLIVSFTIPFMISLASLTVNFILSNIVFYGGTDMLGVQYTIEAGDVSSFLLFCYQHLNLVYSIYIVVYAMIAGGCGIMCTCIAFILPNYKVAYPAAFFLWFMQIISPYSLTYAMQPFIEYGPEYFIPAVGIFVILVSVLIAVARTQKVNHDEI